MQKRLPGEQSQIPIRKVETGAVRSKSFAREPTDQPARPVHLFRLGNLTRLWRLREPCGLYCSGFDEKARRIEFARNNGGRAVRC